MTLSIIYIIIYISCRNRVQTTTYHKISTDTTLQHALFLEPQHTTSRGENSGIYTRTVQQHPPCSVITAQEVELQIRLCTD